MTLADKELIIGMKSEDKNVSVRFFNYAYDKYYKLVCFCIYNYINNPQDVEELANDVFVSLYLNKDRLDDNRNLKYYIITIAKNKSLTKLSNDSKMIIDPLENAKDISYFYENESNDLIKALEKILDNEELFIVINHLMYGYSFKEIALKLNQTINTISGKYNRALKKANKNLKREDYE